LYSGRFWGLYPGDGAPSPLEVFRIVVILGRMELGGLGFVAIGGGDTGSLNGGSGAWFLNS
jgi:hypothetical protein